MSTQQILPFQQRLPPQESEMRLRSARGPTPWSWGALPLELRLGILKMVATDKHPGWGSQAAVCREWQQVIERYNFCKLKLSPNCLGDFPCIVPRDSARRLMVQHVWLDIQLPRYAAKCYEEDADEIGYRRHEYQSIVHKAIRRLLAILSRWTREGPLTLEVNAYSPSDSQYWFQNIFLSSDTVEDTTNNLCTCKTPTKLLWDAERAFHNSQFGTWYRGDREEAPREAGEWLFRDIPLETAHFPRPRAVTGLVLRRQFRRSFLVGQALVRLFPGLEAIWFEPWEPYRKTYADLDEAEVSAYCHIFEHGMAESVKTLVLYGDSPTFYSQFRQVPQHSLLDTSSDTSSFVSDGFSDAASDDEETPVFVQRVSQALAAKSVKLQSMAVSFIVPAEKILQQCDPTWQWPQLETLALTSPTISLAGGYGAKIEALLCSAARFAARMPRLQTLVLWNGGIANAAAFIFRRNGNHASITWRGIWVFDFTPRVVACWQRVATDLGAGVFHVARERRMGAPITSHGEAIYQLNLPCQVITPESLWQIRREAFVHH